MNVTFQAELLFLHLLLYKPSPRPLEACHTPETEHICAVHEQSR